MFKFIALLGLVAVALAQSGVYQPLTTPVTLANGVNVLGSQPVTATSDLAYNLDYYVVNIPENATTVKVKFNQFGSCSYSYIFVNTYVQPCGYYNWDSIYACQNNDYTYYSDDDTDYYPYSSYGYGELFQYAVGKPWYISISKYSTSYYDYACTYNFTVSWNECAGTNAVGILTSSSPAYTCATYTNAGTTNQFTVTASTSKFNVYKFNLTSSTARVEFRVNATTSNLDVIGANYLATTYVGNYDCYTSSGSSVGGNYIYTVNCITPRAGAFYLVVENEATTITAYNFVMDVNIVTCPAGFGGYNCSAITQPLNVTSLIAGFTVNVPQSPFDSDYPMVQYYWDIPQNFAPPALAVVINAVAASGQSGYTATRRNGYPAYESYGYEYSSYQIDSFPSQVGLNYYDFAVPGRIYYGLICYTSTGCSVTVSLNGSFVPAPVPNPPPPAVTGTPPAVTGTPPAVTGTPPSVTGQPVDGEDSSSFAYAVIAPIAAVFVSVIMMF